jgi:RHS repeat-associated protein
MTDALGAVVEKTRYDDFGNFTRDPSIGQPYLYQGRWYDSETGLFYYRNRYYDPVVGRFIQRDPVWDPNNVGNQYTFVGNNPASRFDPLGLQDDEDDGEEGDEQTPDPTGGTGGSDGAREDGVIVTWLKSYFFGDKSICKNMTISRSSKSSHGVPDPLGHTMLESTPEERAEQQELENRTNAAGDAAAGGAAIVASGLHPAEAATGLVVGEAVDNVSEPTEEPGILRTIWNALTSIFD